MRAGSRSVFLAGTALIACAIVPSQGQPGPKATATPRPPSQSARIKALPEEERRWLTEFVAAIVLDEEKKTFLDLAAGYQREIFKEDFWQRREQPGLPIPLGPGYRYRYQELWELANGKYDGWREDAGRMVLRWGEPLAILVPRCGGNEVFRDLEVWTYNLGPSGRTTMHFIFYRPNSGLPRKFWSLTDDDRRLFIPNSCRTTLEGLRSDCSPDPRDRCLMCDDRCDVYKAYREILARQGNGAGAMIEQATVFKPPEVSIEGLERMKDRWATTSDPKAKKIGVEGPSTAPQDTSGPSRPSSTPTPEPRHRLSAEEIRERILRLEPKYRSWLDLAGPLLTEEDLSRFLQLSPGEKDQFIREFWKRSS